MKKDAPIGVVYLALNGKNHPIAVYRQAVPPDTVKRLHPNWPREFFGILMHPWDEESLTASNEIRIFEFDKHMSCGTHKIKIDKQGTTYSIRSDNRIGEPAQ